jgi:hypothetical protein
LELILEKLPNELYTFYDEILRRVKDAQVRNDSFKALRWIMHAARDLWLEEIPEACGTMPSPHRLFDVENSTFPLDFVESLSGLIHIEPALADDEDEKPAFRRHKVTVAHFSVGEYLGERVYDLFELETNFYSRYEANRWLSLASFAYLGHIHSRSLSTVTANVQRKDLLFEYASTFWPERSVECV